MMHELPAARSAHAVNSLVSATVELASAGAPLMRRVVPSDEDYRVWDHYPADDAIDAARGTRWFYHAHAPKPEWPAEHGHFHLFFDRRHFSARRAIARPPEPKRDAPKLVHVIALSIDQRGLPVRVFTVNRWATDEWMYPAGEIVDRLPGFVLSTEGGDALVDRWLSAAVGAFAPEIREALIERDRAIAGRTADFFEARDQEMLSCVEVDLERLG
jgi:hypothetical protein